MADVALVDRIRPGDHVCWTFADDSERRLLTAHWARAALRDRHRVICRTGVRTAAEVDGELTADGLDTAAAVRAGRLRIVPATADWLSTGTFDADAADRMFAADLRRALHDGLTGLRVVTDMSWAAGQVTGAEQLGRFERQLNRRIAGGFAAMLCLYDRRLFGEPRLSEATRAHPAAVTERSSPTGRPLLRMVRHPDGLRLTGEADLSNRDAFATVLGHLMEDAPGPTVVLDLTELRFADATSCRLMVTVARQAGGRLRAIGARSSLRRLLSLQGADLVPGLLPPEDTRAS